MEIYIGIPCYKVAESIEGVLERLLKVRSDLHIILVNDGSPDNLDEVVKKIDTSSFLSFCYHKHSQNKGYGGAQKTIFNIFKSKAQNKNDLLIIVHGDGQTAENEINEFIKTAEEYPFLDAILGSRMLNSFSEQKRAGRPIFKILADYILTFIQNFIYGLNFSTYASGYRCFTKKGLDKMNFDNTSDKHIFDTESLILFKWHNIKYREIKVKVVPNDTGISANHLKDYAKNTIGLAFKYAFKWHSKAPRFLIINSDDYGYSTSVNEAISHAFLSKSITSASILANSEYFDDAITKAKSGNYLNLLGVHINLTQGLPIGKNYKTLLNDKGEFKNIYSFIKESLLKKLNYREILSEIDEQIKKCLSAGITINHIDSHQWIQILPEISRAMSFLAEKYKIPCIRNQKETFPFRFMIGASIRSIINSFVILIMRKNVKTIIDKYHLQSPDYYAGIILTGHKLYESSLEKLLKNLKPGTTELMCHLGSENYSDLKSKSYYTKERNRELKIITSERLKKSIQKKNIKLISYNEFAKM